MRIDFNVLWVDDQPDRIKAQIDAIKRRMQDEGFHFNPSLCESPDELTSRIGDEIFKDEIDLVLVDWDLGQGVEGQDVIETIREKVPYKDVVFYSAQTEATELQRLAFEKGVEGVYCSARADLVDEVVGVFESLIKKVVDLDHVRGIVMGATSDVDSMVNECLTSMHQLLDEAGQGKLLEASIDLMNGNIDRFTERVARIRELPTMASLFEAHDIFTANDRLRVLSRLLENEFDRHVAARPSVTSYMRDVVPKRNKLGHMILVPEGKPSMIATSDGNTISVETVREMRKVILALRSELRDLRNDLQAEAAGFNVAK